jgi:hypothetical protein
MKPLLIVSLLAFAGCAGPKYLDWPVDELEAWNGEGEAWVVRKLGKPEQSRELAQPVPDIGHLHGVQRRITERFPEYSGIIRQLTWKKKEDNFLVLLVKSKDAWVVLDAVKWKDGVEF